MGTVGQNMDFKGNFVALVTPFRDGKIDFDAFGTLIEEQIAGGVAGLVPCGTTGESPTLTFDEHVEVITQAIAMAKGRVPVIAGTGSNSTEEAISLSQRAEAAAASALLVVAPYYNKPSPEGLFQHYTKIADNTELPIIVYNIPGRCGVEISSETILRLAEHPHIAAVKEATGKLQHVSELRKGSDLAILSGDDAMALPVISLGGSGVISVLSNLEPSRMSKLLAFALEGDFDNALVLHDELFPLMDAMLHLAVNPVVIKTAMAIRGKIREEFRLPICPMDASARSRLAALL